MCTFEVSRVVFVCNGVIFVGLFVACISTLTDSDYDCLQHDRKVQQDFDMLSKFSIPLVPAYVGGKMNVVFDISIIDKVKSTDVTVPYESTGQWQFIMRSCDNVIMRSCDDVIVCLLSCNRVFQICHKSTDVHVK
jgi:hypothetical protein